MNYLNTILTNELISALGWTLIHSLWQVAIVAIVLALVLLVLKRSSSAIRYYVSSGAMLTVLLLAVITFLGEYSSDQKAEIEVYNVQTGHLLANDNTKADIVDSMQKSNFTEKSIAYFNNHLPLIVLIWQIH